MDGKTKEAIPSENLHNKNVDKTVEDLAALLYYADKQGPKIKNFGSLPQDERAPYLVQAVKALQAIDKMNMTLIQKGLVIETFEARTSNVDRLEGIIKGFLTGVKHPKNVADFFPSRELAVLIVGGKKK